MKNVRAVAWSVVSLLALACAQTTGGSDPEGGDGDSAGSGSTGTTMGSGGGTGSGGVVIVGSGGVASGGGAGTGATTSTGGGPVVDTCTDGETASCAAHSMLFPAGIALCRAGAWDINNCGKCTADELVPCIELQRTLPVGSVTCNSAGDGFVEDPLTVCQACVEGEKTSCDGQGNPTANTVGNATCTADGGYDWSGCKLCKASDTLACSSVPGNDLAFGDATCNAARDGWDVSSCTLCEASVGTSDCTELDGGAFTYTSGTATCDSTGDAFDVSLCEYCGDDTLNGVDEECDGAATSATTCDVLGFATTEVVDQCTASCEYDVGICGACGQGVEPTNCMEGNPVACTGAACSNKGCGAGSECNFSCINNAANKCSASTCAGGATCNYACYSGGGCPDTTCRDGSECTFLCYNSSDCTGINCEDGANCSMRCENGGTCSTAVPAHCKSGDSCEINCTNSSNCTGVNYVCEAGSTCEIYADNNNTPPTVTCETGATCNLRCANRNCPTITCTGAGCNCLSSGNGGCTGFP